MKHQQNLRDAVRPVVIEVINIANMQQPWILCGAVFHIAEEL